MVCLNNCMTIKLRNILINKKLTFFKLSNSARLHMINLNLISNKKEPKHFRLD